MGSSLFARLWVYQQERFPLASYTVLVAVVVIAGFGFSSVARSASAFAEPSRVVATFFVVLGFFLQLRILDEFKDYAEDAAFRPYRPVPRGLVTLHELALVALAVGVTQVLLSLWMGLGVVLSLLLVWSYMLAMRIEFGVPTWLKARPVWYLLSHMVILPLILLYVAVVEWQEAKVPWTPYSWYFGVAYANGIIFEIGRKIRAPADEEEGVETYSYLWRPRAAVMAWLFSLLLATWLAVPASRFVDETGLAAVTLAAALTVAAVLSARFLRAPKPGRGKWFEWYAASWQLLIYLVLGIVPAIRWYVMG